MTQIKTGYETDTTGSWIRKDPSAHLTYSMDWSEWLPDGDTIASVTYTLQVRANDPTPLVLDSSGVQSNIITYCEIHGGGVGKIYTVTALVTTVDGLVDSRSFRIKVEHRSA